MTCKRKINKTKIIDNFKMRYCKKKKEQNTNVSCENQRLTKREKKFQTPDNCQKDKTRIFFFLKRLIKKQV